MKNNLTRWGMCLVSVLIFGGCTVTMKESSKIPAEVPQSVPISKPVLDLNKIAVGMSIDQVKSALGQSIDVGQMFKQEGQTAPVTVPSLQKEETVDIHGKKYQVLYYFTYIVRPDEQVTEDETTPLVFENGILIAKTWDEFHKIQ